MLHPVAAGVVGGPDGVVAIGLLAEYAAEELVDVQRLAEKLVSLGGTPPVDVGTMPDVPAGLREP